MQIAQPLSEAVGNSVISVRRFLSAFIFVLAVVCCAGPGCRPPVAPERDLLVATASVGGTFYPVGVAMASLWGRELADDDILASAITSSGSAENIRMLELHEAQVAIVQSLFASMAWKGAGFYENRPQTELRAMTMLWPNAEQFVVARSGDAGAVEPVTETLWALRGASISLGPRWSGTEVSGRTILEQLGFDAEADFRLARLGFGPGADALANRRIRGMLIGAGIPTAAITQVYAGIGARQLTFLEFTDDDVRRLRQGFPVWERFVIPPDTYPGLEQPVRTVAQPNILVTSAAVDEEVVYLLVKTLWRHIDILQSQHRATRSMRLEGAVDGLPLPLHPGALRFYREEGVEIPPALLPPQRKGEGQ